MVGGGLVLLATTKGLIAYGTTTHRAVWTQPAMFNEAIDGSLAYGWCHDSGLRFQLCAADLRTGAIRWTTNLPATNVLGMSAAGGLLYINQASPINALTVYDGASGRLLWTQHNLNSTPYVSGPPVIAHGQIYVSSNGLLTALAAPAVSVAPTMPQLITPLYAPGATAPLSVTVTHLGQPLTGDTVTADVPLSGGDVTATLSPSGPAGQYAGLLAVPAGTPPNVYTVTVTASDATYGQGSGPISIGVSVPMTASPSDWPNLGHDTLRNWSNPAATAITTRTVNNLTVAWSVSTAPPRQPVSHITPMTPQDQYRAWFLRYTGRVAPTIKRASSPPTHPIAGLPGAPPQFQHPGMTNRPQRYGNGDNLIQAGNLLYTSGSSSGNFMALDAATGTTRWASNSLVGIGGNPQFNDGNLWVSYGGVNRYDPSSGAYQQTYAGDDIFMNSPTVVSGTIYVDGMLQHDVRAIDESTGATLWQYVLPDESQAQAYTAVGSMPVGNGLVYAPVTVEGTGGSAISGTLYALDAATGALRWSYANADDQAYTSASLDGTGSRLVAETASGAALSLDARTGALQWSHAWPTSVTQTLMVRQPAIDSRVAVFNLDAQVVALSLDTGDVLWQAAVNDGNQGYGNTPTTPVLAGGLVFVPCNDSEMCAFNEATGRQVWHDGSDFSGVPLNSVIVNQGNLFVGDESGGITDMVLPARTTR